MVRIKAPGCSGRYRANPEYTSQPSSTERSERVVEDRVSRGVLAPGKTGRSHAINYVSVIQIHSE